MIGATEGDIRAAVRRVLEHRPGMMAERWRDGGLIHYAERMASDARLLAEIVLRATTEIRISPEAEARIQEAD